VATLGLIFPAGTLPSAVTLTALAGAPAATVSLPLSLTGPTTLTGGGNRWAVDFAGPALSYAYQATATIGGDAISLSGTVAGDAQATGYYADQSDVCSEFGSANAAAWSNLDNTTTADGTTPAPDVARIQQALDLADAWVNTFFQDGPFSVPLSGVTAVLLASSWAARYAGRWLYQARGVPLDKTESGEATKYDAMVRQAEREMARFKGGLSRWDAPRRWPSPTGPAAC
jgi:hypothetical protein